MSGEPVTVGEAARLSVNITDVGGVPDDPATISLVVELPDGTQTSIPSGSLTHTGTGSYLYDYDTTVSGRHMARYTSTLPDLEYVIEFDVQPSLLDTTPYGPVYASPAQYRQVTGQDPPADCLRLLANASELLDELLIGAWYETDADQMPTDPALIAAFARAVCWQVHWEGLTGDADGLGLVYPSMAIGSVSISRGSGGAGATGTPWDRAAPRVVTVLRTAVDSNQRPLIPKFPIARG